MRKSEECKVSLQFKSGFLKSVFCVAYYQDIKGYYKVFLRVWSIFEILLHNMYLPIFHENEIDQCDKIYFLFNLKYLYHWIFKYFNLKTCECNLQAFKRQSKRLLLNKCKENKV